jgi:hypothetical protein
MRALRFLYVTFAYGVMLAFAIYLVVNIAGVFAAEVKRHTLRGEITDRITEVLPTSQQFVGPVADQVGVDPTHSWTAQHCDFRSNGSGWVVVHDYRQVCWLESVHAWQVDSKADALTLLGAPAPAVPTDVYKACHTFLDPKVAYVEGVRFSYIEPSAAEDRWCEPTDREHSQRRPVTGELPDLANAQGWLVVVEEIELVDEVIGCAHRTVVLCTNPFGDRPTWGEPPA